jgi:hypothetical protein
VAFVWAYDLNDLAAVKAGQKRPWDVVPYATWELAEVGFNGGPLVHVYGLATDAPSGNDFLAPTTTLTVPQSGSTVSSMVRIAASATDNVGIAWVRFYVDGALVGSPDTSPPYETDWLTTTTPNGFHTVQAEARDLAGNVSASVVAVVTVANGDPRYREFSSPASGRAKPRVEE